MSTSVSRTITLATATPDPNATLRWPGKTASDVLDYSIDLDALFSDGNDVLTSFAFLIDQALPTLVNADRAVVTGSNVATTVLSAGTAVTDYSLTLVAQSATRTFVLRIWIALFTDEVD